MGFTHNNVTETNEEPASIQEQERFVILVVDDEEEIRTVLRLTLTRTGYDVREAEDGESALESIQDNLPDLILLDVLMPGMDGFEVCRRIRGGTETAHIPILMLSAKTDTRSRQKGILAGATKYLTKPIAPAQLVQHVDDALNIVSD